MGETCGPIVLSPIVLARPLNTEAYPKNRNDESFRIFVNSVVKQCCSSLQLGRFEKYNVTLMRRVKRKERTPRVFQCSIYRSGRPIVSFSERAASPLPSACLLLNVIDISVRSRSFGPSENQNGFGRPQYYPKDSGLERLKLTYKQNRG